MSYNVTQGIFSYVDQVRQILYHRFTFGPQKAMYLLPQSRNTEIPGGQFEMRVEPLPIIIHGFKIYT